MNVRKVATMLLIAWSPVSGLRGERDLVSTGVIRFAPVAEIAWLPFPALGCGMASSPSSRGRSPLAAERASGWRPRVDRSSSALHVEGDTERRRS